MKVKAGSEKLRLNKNPIHIASILDNAREKRKKVVAWMIWGASKLTADLILKVIRTQRNELVMVAIPGHEENFKKILGASEKINFYIPNEKVLFQAKFKENDAGRIVITMPEQITQVERRSFLRLSIPEDFKVTINFNKRLMGQGVRSFDQLFQKKCFDISPGGVSFIISRTEERFFEKSDIISNVKLIVEDREMLVDLKVTDTTRLEPNNDNRLMYAGTKIGTTFDYVSKEDRIFLEQYVFNYIEINFAIGL